MQIKPLIQQPKLAERVAEKIEQQIIRKLSPGQKIPALRTLASRLKVSVSTLQSAIAVLRQRGLVESRQGSGVFVSGSRNLLRVGILSELDPFASTISPFFRTVISGLRTRLAESKIEPIHYLGHVVPGEGPSDTPTCPELWEDVSAGRLDGVVVVNTPSTPAWYRRVNASPVPMVGALTPYRVELDWAGMTKAAVGDLAGKGCKRLGLIGWGGEDSFREEVKGHGLSTSDAWVRTDLDPGIPGAGWTEFRQIWSSPGGRPDGLVVLDDRLFIDVQLAILELGVQVPYELQLAVFVSRGISQPVRMAAALLEIEPEDTVRGLTNFMLQRLAGELIAPVPVPAPFRLVENGSPPARCVGEHLVVDEEYIAR